MPETTQDVLIVGGGVAGLSASIFTARHGLDTLVIDADESILRRNAHLENFPGFPAGINPRQLLDLLTEQAAHAGAELLETRVTALRPLENGFLVESVDFEPIRSTYVVAATKNEVDYLDDVDDIGIIDRGKSFVDVDERGRTGIEGLYAAGRLAEKPHQAVVCAGHGAEVAVTILEDDEEPFYHDWVAPDGYFTDRDRDLPPGCEELTDPERRDREAESLETMQDRFAEGHPSDQETHPTLED